MQFGEFNELIGVTAQLAMADRYRDDDRSATLLDAPAGLSFLSQLKALVVPQGTLKVVEHDEDDERKLEPLKVEQNEATSDAWHALAKRPLSQKDYLVQVSAARRAATAEKALLAGEDLPAAVRRELLGDLHGTTKAIPIG